MCYFGRMRALLGRSIGFSLTLDNPKSAKYQPSYASVTGASGNGYSNNRVFASTTDNQTTAGVQNTAIGKFFFILKKYSDR